MRVLPLFIVVLLALVLASFGCQPGTGGGGDNTDPTINGVLAVDATPRTIVPGGTSVVTVIASDADAADTLTFAYAIDDAAKGTIVAGATADTAVFTAAADAAEGTVATLTVTVDDGNGGTATASVDVTISQEAGFAVPEGTAAGYVGDDTCARCHSRTHDRWSDSGHAGVTYTGTRAAEFDATWTNVECEDCHGPGHDHATAPQQRTSDEVPWDQINVPTHEVCATCHVTGTGAPATFTEWSEYDADPEDAENALGTAHFRSMEPMDGRDADEAYCLDCHSAQRIELQQDILPPPEVVPATLVNDPEPASMDDGVTCLVCHSPHSATARDPNTSDDFGVGSLCLECHSTRNTNSPFTDTPGFDDSRGQPAQPRFNPAGDFIQTTLGYAEDGTELAGDPSPHVAVTDPDPEGNGHLCVACHMFQSATNAGHTWQIRLESGENRCQSCHPGQSYLDGLQPGIQARLDGLEPYMPPRRNWDTDPSLLFHQGDYDALSDADKALYEIAVWDYGLVSRDGSTGAHNPAYAKAVLAVAEGIINELTGSEL